MGKWATLSIAAAASLTVGTAANIAVVPTITVGPNVLVSREADVPHLETAVAANPKQTRNLIGGAVTASRADYSGAVRRVLLPGAQSDAVEWRLRIRDPQKVPDLHVQIGGRVAEGPK